MTEATPQQPQPPEQLKLADGQTLFQGIGLDVLPAGASSLTRKQLHFCLEFLRCGVATEAARRAGYSSPDSDGSKVQRSAGVAAFLGRAGVTVAKNADQLVCRAARRSTMLHEQIVAEMEKKPELRDHKLLEKLHLAVVRTDMLLGSLLGKLGISLSGELNVNHGGTVNHEHTVAIPAEALPGLAEMRREVVSATRTGGPN